MSSEGNKVNDVTSFQPSEPALCANGCGFFGTAATMNLCSKCYRDLRVKEEQAASAMAAMDKLVNQNQSQITSIEGSLVQSRGIPSTITVGETSAPADLVANTTVQASAAAKLSNRCSSCNKKVGVFGFMCRCGSTYCGMHRYPEKHDCTFDFKSIGRNDIAKNNPMIKADKLEDRF